MCNINFWTLRKKILTKDSVTKKDIDYLKNFFNTKFIEYCALSDLRYKLSFMCDRECSKMAFDIVEKETRKAYLQYRIAIDTLYYYNMNR